MKLTPLMLFAGSLVMPLLSGCHGLPGPPEDSQELIRPEEQVDFHRLYQQNCSACHGINGTDGPALDLANPQYQLLVSDDSLKKWITGGVPGTQMPAFGESAGGLLTNQQVRALVTGMRTAWSPVDEKYDERTPPYISDLAGDPKRGEQIYTADCQSCHRSEKQRVTNTAYLALVSDRALRTIIIAGRPDLGHPGWNNAAAGYSMSDRDVTDVVSYLASLRTSTPGQPYPEQPKR
jgi:mono/diheme cytochrome c family protein